MLKEETITKESKSSPNIIRITEGNIEAENVTKKALNTTSLMNDTDEKLLM